MDPNENCTHVDPAVDSFCLHLNTLANLEFLRLRHFNGLLKVLQLVGEFKHGRPLEETNHELGSIRHEIGGCSNWELDVLIRLSI